MADHFAEDEQDALHITRNIIENLNFKVNDKEKFITDRVEDPLYPADEVYGIVSKDARKPFDVREIIARLVDGSKFHEFKAKYGDNSCLWIC